MQQVKLSFILIAYLLYTPIQTFCQKPILDSTVFDNWQFVSSQPLITNDGKFVFYAIENSPKGNRTLVINDLDNKLEWKYANVSPWNVLLTDDSKQAIFKRNDSLFVLELEKNNRTYIPEVLNYQICMHENKQVLTYLRGNKNKSDLIIRYIPTEKEDTIKNVNNYFVSQNGALFVFVNRLNDGQKSSSLYSLLRREEKKILNDNCENVVFNKNENRIAFITENNSKKGPHKSVWLYNIMTSNVDKLIDDSAGLEDGLKIDGIQSFSYFQDGLFLILKEPTPPPSSAPNNVKVDVWSYNDPRLQSEQLLTINDQKYVAHFNFTNRHLTRLNQDFEKSVILNGSIIKDSILLLNYQKGYSWEWKWNPLGKPANYILNIRSGRREKLFKHTFNTMISPTGKYIYGIDSVWNNLYCYDIINNRQANLTNLLSSTSEDRIIDLPEMLQHKGFEVAMWLPDDKGIIMYDNFDIWLLDPQNKKKSINLTNGYGRKNNTQFRLAGEKEWDKDGLKGNGPFILTGFNYNNKEIGFYNLFLKDRIDNPILLSKGNYVYDVPLAGHPIIKAKNKNIFVLLRSSVTDAPNVFTTSDFKTFTDVSKIYPEKKWNWIQSELITWKSGKGSILQGVLYKPENFDSTKKYPIIFSYYERLSDRLNFYPTPGPTGGLLNIPWFVSQGYLVFTPDIHYQVGHPGKGILDAIESAADFLVKLPYVDSTKMGLQGHSWSGYETNFLITHSHRFAAAVSGAGLSNLISMYGTIIGQLGMNAQYFIENSQLRIGTTPWDSMNLFIENSPIFNIDQVTTPLLMVNNKSDGLTPFAQGMELFLGLRRLRKRVWLLQYDNSGHLLGGIEAIDYTKRINQFFDYYLKGISAPKWMLDGIPAKYKGYNVGFDLDMSKRVP